MSEEKRAAAVEKAPKLDEGQRTKVQAASMEARTEFEPGRHRRGDRHWRPVPRTVVYHPLPPPIVEIVPAYSGYVFFIAADGTIVIVDPNAYVIVHVISV